MGKSPISTVLSETKLMLQWHSMDLAQGKAGAQFPSSNVPTLCRCHSELAGCA